MTPSGGLRGALPSCPVLTGNRRTAAAHTHGASTMACLRTALFLAMGKHQISTFPWLHTGCGRQIVSLEKGTSTKSCAVQSQPPFV